jgi:tetratricopeptide (TPR) repeat protein
MSVEPVISPKNTGIDAEHPWPGLDSFTEKDCEYFYGRPDETADLFRLVKRDTLTVLFGSSGLGKTSLLKAGLFPKLIEAEFLPIYLRLTHSDAPEPLADQVRRELEALIDAHHVDAPKPREGENLSAYFHRNDVDFWGAKNRLLIPVLVFDQFEEIFTLGRENVARQERATDFFRELADLVERRPPAALKQKWESHEQDAMNFSFEHEKCKVILSLREDYLSDLEGLRPYMRSVMRNRLRIRRMNGKNAFEVVMKPAPGLVDDEVARQLVQLVAHARTRVEDAPVIEDQSEGLVIEPALLSLVCSELNARRIEKKQTKITADLLAESYQDILKTFYNKSVASLSPEVRFFIEDRLLTRSGYRASVAIEDALAEQGMTKEIIEWLVKCRLLTVEDRLGVPSVELTHDILTTVIRESRDTRQKQEADAALAAERERAERERREAAKALAAEQARVVREKRRTRLALGALAVSIIFAVLFILAGYSQLEAKRRAVKATERADMFRSKADDVLEFMVFNLRDKLSPIGRLQVLQDVNDKTLAYFDELQGSEMTDASLYRRAVALETKGNILYEKRNVGEARKAYKESLTIFRSLTRRDPTRLAYQAAVALESSQVAKTRCAQGNLKAAMKSYNEAVNLLRDLVKTKDPQPWWSKQLANVRDCVADGLMAQGKLEEALKLYEQSLQERRQSAADRVGDEEQGHEAKKDNDAGQNIDEAGKGELSQSDLSIGDALRALGELPQALKYQLDALALRKQLVEDNPTDVSLQHNLSQSYDRVGAVLQDLGRLDEALEAFKQSNEIFEKLTTHDPDNVDYLRNYAVTFVRLVKIYAVEGNTGVAAEDAGQILKGREILADIDESNADAKDDLSEACVEMGDILLLQGKLKGSAEHYERAFQLRSETAKKDSTNLDRQELLAESHEKKGDILFAQGNLDGALQDYKASREIRQTLADSDQSNTLRKAAVATSNEKLGDVHRARGDMMSALGVFQQAVTIRKALAEKDPSNLTWQSDLAIAYRKLAEIEVAQRNRDSAAEHFQQSLDILIKLTQFAPENGEWQASLCDTRTAFANACQSNGNSAEAVEAFRPVLKLREDLAKLDETNVKRQFELAHALYLSAALAPKTAKSNAAASVTLERAKSIMQSLKEKAELTAEQQGWLKQIEETE